jgi:hypothetical protein
MVKRRCAWCKHYRVQYSVPENAIDEWTVEYSCAVNGPLSPCSRYQREPGADDDKEQA